MKHINSILPLAAIAAFAIASCNKLDTPAYEPVVYTLQNAKINLGATRSQGPIGCVELHDDGTYIAEVFADYEGLDKYVQIPFERILVGVKDSKPANYITGTYTATGESYSLSGLGTLSFDNDMMFANYTYQGVSYRDRTGLTPAERLPDFKPAAGKWTPVKTDVKVTNYMDNTEFVNSYNSLDFESISADVAASCAPELSAHLDVFKGYRIKDISVSSMNSFIVTYTNGKVLGGYWNFDNKNVNLDGTFYDKDRKLEVSLSPMINGDNATIGITIVIKDKQNDTLYKLTAQVEMK